MLESLWRNVSKALATLLFSILLLSFALWGIPNPFGETARAPIATVGTSSISVEEFTTALNERRAAMSQQFRTNLTPEQARAFGLDQQVLSELVSAAAVSEHARQMGLRLSDAYLADEVKSNPAFQGGDKKFSKTVFEQQIRQVGLSTERYFVNARQATLREQITSGLAESVAPNPVLLDIAHKFREETRTFAYITLDPAKVAKPAAPDEAELKKQYERIKGQFKTPETRKLSVLFLTRDEVRSRIKVEDAEVKAAWEKAQSTWDIPERRKYQIVVFKDKTAAIAAAKEIAAGKAMFVVALEQSGAAGRLDQGPATRREIGDAKTGQAVFTLPVGQLSDPIDVRGGGVALVRVTDIEAGRKRPFDEVAKDVRASLEQARLAELEKQLHEQVEDRRGARKPFVAIAAELKLKLIEVASSDSKGQTPAGKPALEHPDAARLIATAFQGDKSAVRDVVPLTGGGEAWVEVNEVTAEAQKPFEAVKADVTAVAIEIEHQKAITAAAEALVERIKKGETLEAVAKSQALKVETGKPIKRIQPGDILPANGARLAFTLPKGGAASVEKADTKARLVFVITDIAAAAAPTKEESERLATQLRDQLQNDALATYVAALQDRIGFKINQVVYERAVGIDRTTAPKK
ncbi:MAG: SurA N-terminal domain-containing protein [Hyphomicrobiaceae bacterium]